MLAIKEFTFELSTDYCNDWIENRGNSFLGSNEGVFLRDDKIQMVYAKICSRL